MRVATLLCLMLSGCLYVWHSEDEGGGAQAEVGIEYRCTFRLNGVNRDERVCGPLVQDPDYVIAHLPWRHASQITCTATSDLCVFQPEPVDPAVDAGVDAP